MTSPKGAREPYLDVMLAVIADRDKYAQLQGPSEGVAVLRAALEGLVHAVRADGEGATPDEHRERMRAEAIQVAAMAIKFVEDVCDGGGE